MLRVWRVGEGDSAAWRVSLEETQNGVHRAFASLEQLIDFVKERVGIPSEPASDPSTCDAPPPARGL
jgi:hypothetical protein